MEDSRDEQFPDVPPSEGSASESGLGGVKKANRLSALPPPYWQHKRTVSNATQTSLDRAPPISLEDNTEQHSPTLSSLWARSICIDNYVIVKGRSGIGAYVVWICIVQTLDGGTMTIRKRYSEFDALRQQLVAAFPQSAKRSLPTLPPKSAIYKFRPQFLERRRQGLAYFLNCVMLNPEYAGSEAVKDFIFEKGDK